MESQSPTASTPRFRAVQNRLKHSTPDSWRTREESPLERRQTRSGSCRPMRSGKTSPTPRKMKSHALPYPDTPTTRSCQSPSSQESFITPTSPTRESHLPLLQLLYPSIQRRLSNPTIQEFTARQLHQGGTAIMAMVATNSKAEHTEKTFNSNKMVQTKKPIVTSLNNALCRRPERSLSRSLRTKALLDTALTAGRCPSAQENVADRSMDSHKHSVRHRQHKGDDHELVRSRDILTFYSWSSLSSKDYCDQQTQEATQRARASLKQSLRNNPLLKALANM